MHVAPAPSAGLRRARRPRGARRVDPYQRDRMMGQAPPVFPCSAIELRLERRRDALADEWCRVPARRAMREACRPITPGSVRRATALLDWSLDLLQSVYPVPSLTGERRGGRGDSLHSEVALGG